MKGISTSVAIGEKLLCIIPSSGNKKEVVKIQIILCGFCRTIKLCTDGNLDGQYYPSDMKTLGQRINIE